MTFAVPCLSGSKVLGMTDDSVGQSCLRDFCAGAAGSFALAAMPIVNSFQVIAELVSQDKVSTASLTAKNTECWEPK